MGIKHFRKSAVFTKIQGNKIVKDNFSISSQSGYKNVDVVEMGIQEEQVRQVGIGGKCLMSSISNTLSLKNTEK